MTGLDLAGFLLLIKNAWNGTIANEDLIQTLLEGMIYKAGLKGKSGDLYTIGKSKASDIINRKPGNEFLPNDVVELFSRKGYKQVCISSFDQYVIPMITPTKRAILIDSLKELIDTDPDCDAVRELLLAKASIDTFSSFLVDVFFYVGEKKPVRKLSEAKRAKVLRKPLERMDPPTVPDPQELRYIEAIVEAVNDREHTRYDYSEVAENPKYADRLKRYREDFFGAETVKRGCRDVFPPGESPFDTFKEEIFEGVIDEWECDHKDGMECMTSVLKEAVKINTGRTILEKESVWIGPAQKKGTCHMLVNEKRIEGWVKKDEDGSE